jgi:AcrR family transcriptional regulator
MYPKARITRAERQAATRQELIDAAGRVFLRRGYEGASIEAIAEEAGYTRGAFYSNFGSKAELLASARR